MKLTRIRIEQFRQFRQALEIRALDAGINLFTGANEAGKSTVLAALRAAFFERHRSSSVDDFRPWGDSSATPSVELDFSIGNQDYRLSKSFLGKKRCELQVGSQRLDGADAEDHLADLLGFRYAGRGASAAEHWGIPGLLWIEQGEAQEVRESVTHATDHLRSALNESLGEVASSGGDEVIASVESARNELLTPATGAPRGAYAAAIKHETALASELEAITAEIASYRQKVDTLSSLRREHLLDEQEKPWLHFRQEQQAASEKLAAIARIEETHAAEKLRAGQIEDRIKLLRDQLESFAGQKQAAEARAATLEKARQEQSAGASLVARWSAKRVEASAAYQAAREVLRLARQEDTRRSLTRQLDEIGQKAASAAAALAKAEDEQATLLERQRLAAAAEIKLTDLETLREQQQKIRELQIRQAAAATRLHFALDDGCRLAIGGESVSGNGERLLLAATAVTLPGLGKLEIAPGGSDLAQLGRQEGELGDRHAAALQRLGLASLDEAEARQRTYAERLGEVRTATATLKALAPKGVDALRSELASQQARGGEIEAALRQLPTTVDGAPAVPPVVAAEAGEEAAGRSLTQINDNLHQAQLAAANAETSFAAARRELESARVVLDTPDRAPREARANHDLVDALAERGTLSARIAALQQEVSEARPDILKQDVERFGRSAEQHEKRFGERRDTLLRLDVELQAAGAQGLEERSAELARDLAQAQRRGEELRRRASALDYLLQLLRDKRRVLTSKLQAPLQRHLNRYLQLLFAQASLEIDENLGPGPLTRVGSSGSESGAFASLSFGAREQMGVISRLAYADLLREAGRPTLIILDDALVHSDDERLAQMKRVLFDAATRHQILLFTCHPANWRDLGVSARSLEALRAAS
ncbi:AAA family ATPase [Accumulibacter sp.]|uniref:AAA family ATPase n=1 Tax=Accumulibacter sp. TaxID=2053492 RepID=UPI001AD01F8E|nr:AAA family ATPase [Accumulibacter sp.]MBN8514100.1 AAA family ATPase [Accumulibacter sp.]MBO3702717.1 AAA family ATPase [Accumulibacter sp.]